ncbi:hypothetical protein PybrP1_010222 [[Pythium] brassicae (nom. inval.)]|nr:hypothetical protein PybrP1_010222 [[Pythium] brassicae (nom. inval.)]
MVSSHEPVSRVSGGTRPIRAASDAAMVDALVAAGLVDDGERPNKRRRLRRCAVLVEEESKGDGEDTEGEESVANRILRRRGRSGALEYLVQWVDLSSEWLPRSELSSSA